MRRVMGLPMTAALADGGARVGGGSGGRSRRR